MKHKKNILMIIIALVLALGLVACGQKTNEAVNDDNMEKSDESMETLAPQDEDSDSMDDEDSDDSTEHNNTDNDSDNASMKDEDSDDTSDDNLTKDENSDVDSDGNSTKDEDNDDSTNDEDSDNASDDSTDNENTAELKVFTLEELSSYNGLDGGPAYVAVDGVVYDFTNLGAWRNGKHNGFTAGRDLTDEILNVSPHGVKNLEGIPIVGSLLEE